MKLTQTTNPAILSHSISVQGAQFTANALLIDKKATNEQMQMQGVFIANVRDASDWWQADWVAAMKAKHGADKAAVAGAALGIEQGTFEFYSNVAELFGPEVRVESLSFEHHTEAMIGCGGDAKLAMSWLQDAVKHGWSVSELRKELRQANADYKRDGRKPTGNGYSAVTDAERWACTQVGKVCEYTPERAKAVLTDLSTLRRIIAQLEAIAGVRSE